MDTNDDVKETLVAYDLFMKMSGFLKYQLDEVLPYHIAKSKLKIPPELVEESESLLLSVKTFIQCMKTLKKTFKITEEVRKPVIEETELWHDVLFEMYNSIDKNTAQINKRGFYCGLCNFYTFDVDQWNKHYKTDEFHIKRDNLAKLEPNSEVEGTFCKYCQIVLYSEKPHLEIIMNSTSHKAIDNMLFKYKCILEDANQPLSRPETPNNRVEVHKPQLPPPFSKNAPKPSQQPSKPPQQPPPKQLVKPPPIVEEKKLSKRQQKKLNKIQPPPPPPPGQGKKHKKENISNNTNDMPLHEQRLQEMLNTKITYYNNKTFISFVGYCILCDTIFTDYFEWPSHRESHGIMDRYSESEYMCEECNIGFIGDKNVISAHYSHSKQHKNIHEMLKDDDPETSYDP